MNAAKPANYAKVKAQELQDKLYLTAKENPKRRFHVLYDKMYREDILREAWRRVKGNKFYETDLGSPQGGYQSITWKLSPKLFRHDLGEQIH